MVEDQVLHLWLKFQNEHKTDLWFSRISFFVIVVKVYVGLSIRSVFIMQVAYVIW